jgi:excisionase family DNA binding protein
MTEPKLLTVPQVAAELQVTAQTIRNWIDHGTLPAVRIGRAFRVKCIPGSFRLDVVVA